jgi:hypothetical protein
MTVAVSQQDLSAIRFDIALGMLTYPEGDKELKQALLQEICVLDSSVAQKLWEAGYCGYHFEKLSADGECPECWKTEQIIGAEMAEARAMREADRIMENDDYFTPEYTGVEYEEEA